MIIHVAVLVMILAFASQRKSYGGKKEKEIKKKKKLGRKRQGAWNLKHFDGKFHFEEKPTRAWDVVTSEPREEGKRASTTPRVTTSGMRWVESKTVEKKKMNHLIAVRSIQDASKETLLQNENWEEHDDASEEGNELAKAGLKHGQLKKRIGVRMHWHNHNSECEITSGINLLAYILSHVEHLNKFTTGNTPHLRHESTL